MMYEDLIKALRDCANDSCEHCAYLKQGENCFVKFCGILQDAADAIEVLSKREKTTQWIPVTERLPEDGSDILAVQSYCGEVRIVPANYDRGVWYDCVFNRVAEHITHWMPLPEPPKEDEHG